MILLVTDKMNSADIEPVLSVLAENNLETWTSDGLASEIVRPDSLNIVGKFNGEVIGYCVSRLIMNNNYILSDNIDGQRKSHNTGKNIIYFKYDCEIYSIAIKKQYQNNGIGQILLNNIVLQAQKTDTESIWLEVRKSNRQAIGFYKKNNFREISERKNFYSNPSENAIVMRKKLFRDGNFKPEREFS